MMAPRMTNRAKSQPEMPEGDTIFRAARTLHRALAGRVVTSFETVLPKLERVNVDTPIVGRTIENVSCEGKWMLMQFSGSLVLLTHMLMSGSWHIYRPGEIWKRSGQDMRVVIGTADFVAVGFKILVAEFHTEDSLRRRSGFRSLGPSVLAENFDAHTAAARLRAAGNMEIGPALLSQPLIAGLGNVFKSEVCFACGVNPFRRIATLSEEELRCLIATALRFLAANVTAVSGDGIKTYMGMRRTTGRGDEEEALWVYRRRGEPCRRCGFPILSRKQGEDARVTFWCARCQPSEPVVKNGALHGALI
jgi:endonuclease VIII